MARNPKHPGIERRGDKWRAQLMANGTRVSKTFDTQDAAVQWRIEQRRKLDARHVRNAPKVTSGRGVKLRDFWPTFLATRNDPTTAAKNSAHWKARIEPALGHRRLADISATELDEWSRGMSAEGLSAAYVLGVRYTLSAMFSEAAHPDHALVDSNPVKSMRHRPQPVMREARILTDAETDQLLAVAPDVQTRALLLVMADSGCRIGEAAALTVADVRGTHLHLHQRVDRTTARVKPGLKNLGTHRDVPQTAAITAALAPLMEGKAPTDLLFTNRAGNPMDLHNFYTRTWWPMVEAAGLEGKQPTPHDMRHTFLTLAAQDFTQHELRDIAGHKDSRSLDRYLHSGADLLARSAAATDARRRERQG